MKIIFWYALLTKGLLLVNNHSYPQAFLKKQRGYCNPLRPSVMISLPKPLVEIQTNLLCELLTWMGRATSNFFFGPAPWGPKEGSKGLISFNFNYKVNFKDFYTKLCVCSHKWKIQNISVRILILPPGSCPRGEDFGALGVPRGSKKKISNMVMWHIRSTGMTSRTERK